MAFVAKDGSKHTNQSSMRTADAKHMAKMPGKSPAALETADGMEPDGDEMGGGGDGAAMAQEHGPAVETVVSHDHQGGQHTVHATHPDGHTHETSHGSAAEAHKYAGDCSGVGME